MNSNKANKKSSSGRVAGKQKYKKWNPRTDYKTLEKRLGLKFNNRDYLKCALTPIGDTKKVNKRDLSTSVLASKKYVDVKLDYQTLEYFGDGALRYVVPHILKKRYPHANQGELTRMYSCITCNTNLAFTAYRLKLPYYFISSSKPKLNRKILADTVEAVIGAVDQDHGIVDVYKVAEKIFKVDIEISRFHEPQDTLLRLLQKKSYIDLIKQHAPEDSPLMDISGTPRISYQLYVIQKRWGKLGHVSVLRLNGKILVQNGEGYDSESASNNAASFALLKLFPTLFPTSLSNLTWRV